MKKFTQQEISKKYVTRSRFQQEVEKNNRLMRDIKLLVQPLGEHTIDKIFLMEKYRKAFKMDENIVTTIAKIAKEHFENESRKKIKK